MQLQTTGGSSMHLRTRVRVVLADDHPVVRIGARATLERDPSVSVIGEAGSLKQLFCILSEHECDALILCLQVSGHRISSGIAAIAAIRRSFPKVRLIIYPDSYSAQTVRVAISLGALGVVAKSEATTELLTALRAVMQGYRYVSSGIHAYAIGRQEVRRLTLGEEMLVQLLADGNSLDDVAHILDISVGEARSQKRIAMGKLGMHTPEELYEFLRSWQFDGPST
ncbi:response regulator transcription factor [Stenotrophomonas maltophilia]|uniref:response regulator transcription factor n=1 Tax=Stenotrophomonas maltophilia TaxID=40324 RepID=UPI001D0C46BB|nr:response regulator transcription factor [Stenotrophomonas maltophilia]UXF72592.1 response regulator transcription factor [Stenotrophomonas maltophilia]